MTASDTAAVESERGTGLRNVIKGVWARPAGRVGLIVIVGLVVLALFGNWIAPHDPDAQDIARRLEGPSSTYWFGTDQLGRDLLSRIIHGVRIELQVALPGVIAALLLGLLMGSVAGYLGGRTDRVMIVIMDSLQAFPSVVLALVLVAVIGSSLSNLALVVAFTFAPQFARVARASVLALRQQPFIEAETALGVSQPRIIRVHVLPNIISPLFVLMAMNIPSAITVEAGLSFLGLGVNPPTPSWGVILKDGFDNIYGSPWAVVFAAVALSITTIGFTSLGETLRDVSDPHLAKLTEVRPNA